MIAVVSLHLHRLRQLLAVCSATSPPITLFIRVTEIRTVAVSAIWVCGAVLYRSGTSTRMRKTNVPDKRFCASCRHLIFWTRQRVSPLSVYSPSSHLLSIFSFTYTCCVMQPARDCGWHHNYTTTRVLLCVVFLVTCFAVGGNLAGDPTFVVAPVGVVVTSRG